MAVPEFVDLHLHADGISTQDLATLAYFGLKAAVTCARDTGSGSADALRKHWDELVSKQTERLRAAGIRPLVALGLHPARIPWHGVDELLHRLPHYFDDPKVVALRARTTSSPGSSGSQRACANRSSSTPPTATSSPAPGGF